MGVLDGCFDDETHCTKSCLWGPWSPKMRAEERGLLIFIAFAPSQLASGIEKGDWDGRTSVWGFR